MPVASVAHAAGCPAPEVRIVETGPTGATLEWSVGDGVTGYFLQYSTGKFPTQLAIPVAPGQAKVTAALVDLLPGSTTTVEFCTALKPNACPGPESPDACRSTVEVTAATARAGTAQPDPARAVCRTTPDAGWRGYWVGGEEESVVGAASAEECCQSCASAGQRLPYVKLCTAFTYDPTAHRCYLYGETGGTLPIAGATAGEVLAWPKP